MKKSIKILLFILVVAFCFSTIAVAETVAEEEENPTFIGNVWNWIKDHSGQIYAVCTIVLGLFGRFWLFGGKKAKEVVNNTANTLASQAEVVKVVNKLIEGYNENSLVLAKSEDTTSQLQAENEELKKELYKVSKCTQVLMEMVYTTFSESRNLSLGVKDILAAKYAQVLKETSDILNEEEVKEEV